MTIILRNFEGVKTLLNKEVLSKEEEQEECYALKCKICADIFTQLKLVII
jgi:hypothetical protein